MDIKQKIKSAWNKLTSKKSDKANVDSELAADEVIEEEIFPRPAKRKCAKNTKPASKRTRPTNDNYQMIDPSNDTVDGSKS